MKITYLTRKDADLGEGLFDSIAWAYEVHVKEPDPRVYNFAILHGNEDAPSKIEFFVQENPNVDDVASWVWLSEEN
jgi:hypothetical protein